MTDLLVAAAAVWLGVHWCYVICMAAKEKMRSGQLKSLYWKVILLIPAVLGFVLDVAFNWSFGTLLFRERPRELLFSDRVQRHYMSSGSRGRMAAWWAARLNEIDAAHIREPNV